MAKKRAVDEQNRETAVEGTHDIIYELFMLAITIYSLVVIVLLLVWPLTFATRTLLLRADLLICIVLVIDFFVRLYRSPNWGRYFFRQGGWLDLLGSFPIIFGQPWTAVLRLARLPRLVGIVKILHAKTPAQIRQELRGDRPKSALLLTLLIAIIMIAVAGAVVLQVEGRSLAANIHTGGDAFWWAFVTITTVGYGDHYPITSVGRLMAAMLMVVGVGIFAVMTSFLASILLGGDDDFSLQDEIAELKEENTVMLAQLDAIKQMLDQRKQHEN